MLKLKCMAKWPRGHKDIGTLGTISIMTNLFMDRGTVKNPCLQVFRLFGFVSVLTFFERSKCGTNRKLQLQLMFRLYFILISYPPSFRAGNWAVFGLIKIISNVKAANRDACFFFQIFQNKTLQSSSNFRIEWQSVLDYDWIYIINGYRRYGQINDRAKLSRK